jgi:hypothetical protein
MAPLLLLLGRPLLLVSYKISILVQAALGQHPLASQKYLSVFVLVAVVVAAQRAGGMAAVAVLVVLLPV